MKRKQRAPAPPSRRSQAAQAGRLPSAVFTLEAAALGSTVESRAVAAKVDALIHRVTMETETAPLAVQVFGNIGAFAVEAPRKFLDRMSAQAEVASTLANEVEEDLLVRSVPSGRSRKPPTRR